MQRINDNNFCHDTTDGAAAAGFTETAGSKGFKLREIGGSC
jgi:hypothetical protein